MSEKRQPRGGDGRYQHSLERVCECGHRAGQHTAERVKLKGLYYQECCEMNCSCECFVQLGAHKQ